MKSGNGHILCVPGQRLCEASSSHVGGEGTYTFNKYIYASLIGKVVVEPQRDLHIVKVNNCVVVLLKLMCIIFKSAPLFLFGNKLSFTV